MRNPKAMSETTNQSTSEHTLLSTDLLDGWRVGQKVWTSVSFGGVRKRMTQGVIVAVHSGYCDVDVMSLHGGAPWIVQQTNSALEAV